VILLVTHFLFGGLAATIATASIGAIIVFLWYALPIVRLLQARRRHEL
jgi:uncharacterized membrane protein YtjA (UPF0391 family)